MDILRATEKPKSVTHLSDLLDIPTTTCYRRVDELAAVGLLEDTSTAEDGTSNQMQYQRTTDAVGIRFAPVPSPFAWSCVRETAGTDTPDVELSSQTGTQSQGRSAPTEGSAPTIAAPTEQEPSKSNNKLPDEL